MSLTKLAQVLNNEKDYLENCRRKLIEVIFAVVLFLSIFDNIVFQPYISSEADVEIQKS